MHALGFWHEQSRYDRDRYINIVWPNVQQGKGENFQKYEFEGLQHVGDHYDLSESFVWLMRNVLVLWNKGYVLLLSESFV